MSDFTSRSAYNNWHGSAKRYGSKADAAVTFEEWLAGTNSLKKRMRNPSFFFKGL